MRFIPTSVHGILDYLMGIIVTASPWILGFNHGGNETYIPVILGLGVILYSLFTDYELGMARRIPMRIHLMLDVAAGIILAVSPWLFNFNHLVYAPHLVFGLLEIGAGLMTSLIPTGCRTCKSVV